MMNMNMKDDGDHSGGSSSSSGSSMVSFEIALQEGGDETTTSATCLLDKSNPYYYHTDDNDIDEDALIRRKYPWRRFKAFLKRSSLPRDTTKVVFMMILLLVTMAVVSSSSRRQRQQQQQQQQQVHSVNFAGQRHVIEHDYFSSTDREYISDYAPISHKCLLGDACTCSDFNPREASQEWNNVHEVNSKMVASNNNTHDGNIDSQQQPYDVIFVGDDLVALWAGNNSNRTTTKRTTGSTNDDHRYALHQYFQQTFTSAGGGDVNGLALGIAGDTTSALRWRFKNGELPPRAQAKIWWLSIGANDLDVTRAGCSEEATLLGIVRAAQDVMYHKKHADGSVHVVIQALLPMRVAVSAATATATLSSRTTRDEKNGKRSNWFSSFFPRKKKNLDSTDDDDDDSRLLAFLLPSIQNINKHLAIFCQQHENVLFFDPSAFLDSTAPQNQKVANKAHLSLEGYKVLGDAIHNEVLRIIRYEK